MGKTKHEIMEKVTPILEKMTEEELSDMTDLVSYVHQRSFTSAWIGGGLVFVVVGLGYYLWNEFGKVGRHVTFTKK